MGGGNRDPVKKDTPSICQRSHHTCRKPQQKTKLTSRRCFGSMLSYLSPPSEVPHHLYWVLSVLHGQEKE